MENTHKKKYAALFGQKACVCVAHAQEKQKENKKFIAILLFSIPIF